MGISKFGAAAVRASLYLPKESRREMSLSMVILLLLMTADLMADLTVFR